MEDKLEDQIDKIIDILEDESYTAYKFFCNKFRFIDKKQKIDVQAKLANNNYYFKDSINDITYIKVKKYINENTTIQQIIKDNGIEKLYYAFIERNNYTSLARVIKVKGNETMVCTNTDIVNHSYTDILKYADSVFEFDKFKPNQGDISTFESYFDKLVDSTSKSNFSKQDYENALINRIEDQNDFFGRLEDAIKEYEEDDFLIDSDYDEDEVEFDEEDDELLYDIENDINSDEPIEKAHIEGIEEFYKKFTLLIGNDEVEGEDKVSKIAELEADVDEVCFDSKMLDNAVIELKAVIEAKMKKDELEK